MLVLASATLAGAEAPPEYASASSSCAALGFFAGLAPTPRCPSVRQEGVLTPAGCAAEAATGIRACRILVTGGAAAEGLPMTRKTLQLEVQTTGDDATIPVCNAVSTALTLSCEGSATIDVPLGVDECREVRVRATVTEGSVATLTTRTEVGFTACRAASGAFTVH